MSSSDTTDNSQYMAKMYSQLIDALHTIATPDDVLLQFDGEPDTTMILDAVWLRIRKIMSLNEMGFLLLDDDGLDFNLTYYQPAQSFNHINQVSNAAIKEGTFAWALNQNRAVVLHGDKDNLSRLFHVVAIHGKVIGMFIATFDFNTDSINETTLGLLSIILLNCANTIEASTLNMKVREQNEVLETKIEERTRQLAIEKTRAEAASIAKSNFLATMSHEIRTPMNGVLGMAQVMTTTKLTEEQHLYLNTILDSGNSLLVVINDILDFSKIEAGKMELENSPFNLNKIITDIISLFRSKASEKNIQLIANIEENCPTDLMGDSLRIKQVLQNLVSNAIKFTEQGSIKINISGSVINGDSASLMINIVDTGIGIAPSAQEKLFSDFTQVDSSTTRKYGGTGLGLAICKQFITLMQGEIGVKSLPDQGATFWFTLNLNLNKHIQDHTSTDKIEFTNQLVPLQGNVLLVEDNHVNQLVAKAILEKFGLTPDIANDGLQAVQKFSNNSYDLILMDCQMPVLDGFEATRQIRKNELENKVNQTTPIVALTANAHDKDRGRCIAAGMDDYLQKPIIKDVLYNVLAQYLKQQTTNKQQQS
ncbi:sensory box histidine kinase/response regulator [hydrothermal vent metagenome]|uniref:histidine kinase n=1 Tax=hydrothermal vent metagenome TaxID=652676 RepID=A0A3B1ALS4_9ZZZZ